MIDADVVRHMARLSRLALTEDEVETMRAELSGILDHIESIKDLDLADVPTTTHVIALENVFREDVPGVSLSQEEALREASRVSAGGFSVGRMG